MPLQLHYWNSKGWGEPIRQLLHYLKIDYEDITWSDDEGWYARKAEFFTDLEKKPFPNSPFLVDGDFILTESSVIPYYICKKFERMDLYGKTFHDEIRVRQVNAVLNELHAHTIMLIFGTADSTKWLTVSMKEGGKISNVLERLSRFLAQKDFVVGYLTMADFKLAYQLKYIRNAALSIGLEDPIVGKYDNLVALVKRVAGLPELEGYAGSAKDHPYTTAHKALWYKEFPLE